MTCQSEAVRRFRIRSLL